MKKYIYTTFIYGLGIATALMSSGFISGTSHLGRPEKAFEMGIMGVQDVYGPEISFEKTRHDFGSIVQGKPVTYKFQFTNTGNSNLIIKDAKAGCGCTTPKWSKEPIGPGKTGFIEVGYDAKAEGNFVKDIKVQTNGGDVKLIITGVVDIEASEPEAPSIQLPTKNR